MCRDTINISSKFANNCIQMQHTATLCSRMDWHDSYMLCTADCNRLQQTATDCNRLQQTATDCNRLQQTATDYKRLQQTATDCNRLQQTAKHCKTLQNTATDLVFTHGLHIRTSFIVDRKCRYLCCSVLQRVAACCSALQCVAVFAVCCSLLQCVAMRCSALQCT